jgi:ABC-type multidrug transport system ATPase subunit
MDGMPLAMVRPHISGRYAGPQPTEHGKPTADAGAISRSRLLQVTGLTKRYGDAVALSDVDFSVDAGEVLGLIGPNGAGKTTLLETVAGLLPADSGEVAWLGRPLPPHRRRATVFYLPDGVRPYQDQFVARVLAFFAAVYAKSDAQVADAVAAVGLAPVLAKRVQSLSKGYGRRLILALGLLTPHSLLLMDEPFDGFDLRQTREIARMLRQIAGEGRALMLAIHQLADAEKVCDRFVLLSGGRIRGAGTLADLRARTGLPAASLEDVFLALT